jgi:hypothetical protein
MELSSLSLMGHFEAQEHTTLGGLGLFGAGGHSASMPGFEAKLALQAA